MRADADFMVYVGARWPALVREAVRQGCPAEQAADAATDALARCRRRWDRASREENVDHLVQEELAAAVGRRARNRSSEPERAQAAEELLVLAPPTLEELRHHRQQQDRHVVTRAAAVVVPLALVASGLAWWLARGDEERTPPKVETLAPAAVAPEGNPAPGVTWYADGQLHLDHAVLAIEGLRDMTRIGTGVVYGDDEGRVVYVGEDGRRTILGHKDPEQPVAATDENGWAAWVDTGGEEPEIVIAEAATGRVLGSQPVDQGARVVAVDGNAVYFVDADGAHSLLPNGPSVLPVTPASLLDVRSRIRVFQLDDSRIQVVQSNSDAEFDLTGEGARLSPDGDIVATRVPDGDDGEIAIYDTRYGGELVNGLGHGDNALAFAPGNGGTITYVVAPRGLTPGRELLLLTCELATKFCHIAARIPNTGTPVLAR